MGILSEMDMMNRDAEDDAFEVSSDSETVDSFSEEFEPVEPPKPEPQAEDAEEARKKAKFDAAEAKRKAEWEQKQREKAEAEQAAWENAVAMGDDEVMMASMKRVGDDAERLTRRNMKQCVTEHIQTKCLSEPEFARQVMHPRKNMIRCFRYITRKAKEFAEQEMKDNDEKPIAGGYGCDVQRKTRKRRKNSFRSPIPESRPRDLIRKPTRKSRLPKRSRRQRNIRTIAHR